jgi:putative transposase
MLNYKLERAGKILIKIDRFFPSSKKCHCCQSYNKTLSLSDRTWTCDSCGSVLDRDINAAINIKSEGLRILNQRTNGALGLACGDNVRLGLGETLSQAVIGEAGKEIDIGLEAHHLLGDG